MSTRADVYRAIAGRAVVEGKPCRRYSRCLLCGLDSGPWTLRFQAALSGLLHLENHHPRIKEAKA